MRTVITLILCLAFSVGGYAQGLKKKYKTYSQDFHRGMRYGLFTPVGYDKSKSYPLIIYLHGSRDTVSRDSGYYGEKFQSEHPSFFLTPKCTEPDLGWGDTWHDEHTPHGKKVVSLIDSLTSVYSIDKKHIYIYGISMGGFGTFSMLAKEPGKFAAAFAICGGSAPDVAPKLVNTPLWIFHGAADDVVPVYLSRDIYKEIVKIGGKMVKYTEYPGVKHNSWDNALREPGLNAWLFSWALK